MKSVTIDNLTRPAQPLLTAGYCSSFICRLRGFMFRRHIQPDEALLFIYNRESRADLAIHMLFVFTDLAVIWINAVGVVVDVKRARAWRPFYAPQAPARYILEAAPQRLNEFRIGDQVHIDEKNLS